MVFYLFLDFKPTRLAKMHISKNVQNVFCASRFETRFFTFVRWVCHSLKIYVVHWIIIHSISPLKIPHGHIWPQGISAYHPPSVPDTPPSSSYQYTSPHH